MVIRQAVTEPVMELNSSSQRQNRLVWHGIMGTGQSLSVGYSGALPEPTRPAAHALRLHDDTGKYDIEDSDASSLRAVALTEPLRTQDGGAGPYPRNIDGLTPHHSMANTITRLRELHDPASEPFITVHSAVGIGGALMNVINKQRDPRRIKDGNNAYAASLFEARALNRLAREQNASLQYDAIFLTHGEADALLNNEQYADDVLKLHSDFAEDVKAITGQSHDPILFLSQQNTCPPSRKFLPSIASDMWEVQKTAPNKVVCTGPKYQFDYSPDGLHLDWKGYERLGEKYGQVFYETVLQKQSFVPLRPTSAKLCDNLQDIIVDFEVPVAPLSWDTSLPIPHKGTRHGCWSKGRGFEVRDARGKHLGIADVNINDSGTSVTVSMPDPANAEIAELPLQLAYAMTQEGEGFGTGFCGGTEMGRMGWLSDSDAGCGAMRKVFGCRVKHDSCEVVHPGGWPGCSRTDVVKPSDLSIFWIEGETAFLERAWDGDSGKADLEVRHNQRNYCVAFSLTIDCGV